MRCAWLALIAPTLAACASSQSKTRPTSGTAAGTEARPSGAATDDNESDRVVWVDGCDENGRPLDVGRRPEGDEVRIVRSCEGDAVCQPGPRARLRDKLACAGPADEGAGKSVKTRPGSGPLHRRVGRRRGPPVIRRPMPPSAPPAPPSD